MVDPTPKPTWQLALWLAASVTFGALIIQLGPMVGLMVIAALAAVVFAVAYGLENALEDAAYLLLRIAAVRREHRLKRAEAVRSRRIQFLEETN